VSTSRFPMAVTRLLASAAMLFLTSCAASRVAKPVPSLTQEDVLRLADTAMLRERSDTSEGHDTPKYRPERGAWWVVYFGPRNVLDADELVVIDDRTRKACAQGAATVNGPCT
jgi:hypothetical protein